ncbi:MAG: NifU family protein [Deltaproteobacteria bacterium]|jgi:Fe-S cluster biogenesis protein NfuA|nr:MAG: NifU family protein [Deltaproteobacteria bacterium]
MLREKVESALDEVRPSLQADGGNVELVDVTDDGVVRVRLQGACAGCPMSQMTLSQGIERHLKEIVPEVKKVEAVL